MRKLVFTLLIAGLSVVCAAQGSIVGDWKTVDDKTGDNYSIVTVYQGDNGLYYGRVSKILKGPEDVTCKLCPGEDKDKPMLGLVIIRDMHMEKGELRGGKVLDPNNGKFYYARLYLKNGKLVLRGSLDKAGILGRNQTWVPADK